MTHYYRWASFTGHMDLPTIEQCERDGYQIIGADPRYPESVLMRKPVTTEEDAHEHHTHPQPNSPRDGRSQG